MSIPHASKYKSNYSPASAAKSRSSQGSHKTQTNDNNEGSVLGGFLLTALLIVAVIKFPPLLGVLAVGFVISLFK